MNETATEGGKEINETMNSTFDPLLSMVSEKEMVDCTSSLQYGVV
jgi:hypothetical protein